MSWLFVILDIRDQDVRIWILAPERHVVRAHMGPAIISPLSPSLFYYPGHVWVSSRYSARFRPPHVTLNQCTPPCILLDEQLLVLLCLEVKITMEKHVFASSYPSIRAGTAT